MSRVPWYLASGCPMPSPCWSYAKPLCRQLNYAKLLSKHGGSWLSHIDAESTTSLKGPDNTKVCVDLQQPRLIGRRFYIRIPLCAETVRKTPRYSKNLAEASFLIVGFA